MAVTVPAKRDQAQGAGQASPSPVGYVLDVAEPPRDVSPPNIQIPQEMFGGVWANLARVSHSQYEFTIDFVRLDLSMPPPPAGVVVARVNMSPLMISQLIDALQTNWQHYAQRAMPREVYRSDDDHDEAE